MPDWKKIQADILSHTGQAVDIDRRKEVTGGCVHQAVLLGDVGKGHFLKWNQIESAVQFAVEFLALQELTSSQTIGVPRALCHGVAGGCSYLLMESMDFTLPQSQSAAQFGAALAALHRSNQVHYGWERDNYIGTTAQINTQTNDWVAFWRDKRLGFQLELAQKNGAASRLINAGGRLLDELPAFFTSYTPAASCLHGDLWSGNWAFDGAGEVVIYDPALYYGDRETDIAMTELFGTAGADFYAAYHGDYPLDSGYSVRRRLYNLYHILNHYNLALC